MGDQLWACLVRRISIVLRKKKLKVLAILVSNHVQYCALNMNITPKVVHDQTETNKVKDNEQCLVGFHFVHAC